MSDAGAYPKLIKRFDDHKTRKQGSQDLLYVTGEQVITRLNDVLGVTGWSWRILREGTTDVEAWVLGELTATIDGVTVTRQHYGNQGLKRGQHAVEDLFKAANTDAIKKAATTIGVGLYLYDSDERREVEQEMRDQARNGGRSQGLGGIPQYQKPAEKTAPLAPVTPIRDGATTPPAGAASPSSSTEGTTVSAGDDKPLKTKAQLVDDMNRGIAMARTLGLEPADVDPTAMNRADIENVIKSLAKQIKIVKAARAEAAS